MDGVMDKELIERLAREAGFRRAGIEFFSTSPAARDAGTFEAVLDDALRRFAALVAEECARAAGLHSINRQPIHPDIPWGEMSEAAQGVAHVTCQCVANAIREKFGVMP